MENLFRSRVEGKAVDKRSDELLQEFLDHVDEVRQLTQDVPLEFIFQGWTLQ